MEWIDRPRGMLTQSDREYLAGEIDYSDEGDQEYKDPQAAERQRKKRIRERIIHGLIDMAFIDRRMSAPEKLLVVQSLLEFVEEDGDEIKNGYIASQRVQEIITRGLTLWIYTILMGSEKHHHVENYLEYAIDSAALDFKLVMQDVYLETNSSVKIRGEEIPLEDQAEAVKEGELPDDEPRAAALLAKLLEHELIDLETARRTYEDYFSSMISEGENAT